MTKIALSPGNDYGRRWRYPHRNEGVIKGEGGEERVIPRGPSALNQEVNSGGHLLMMGRGP